MWYDAIGTDTDVILSTSVDIVRNVRGFNFPARMNLEEKENLIGMVRQAANKSGMNFIRSNELSKEACNDLFRCQVIDDAFLNDSNGKGVLVTKDCDLSVMINQDNHIRIRSQKVGSDFRSAYIEAEKLAVLFESGMDIAYSEKMGFLTSTPTEVGTGVKISFIAALPGLEKAKVFTKLIEKLERMDWQVTPIFGESKKHATGYYRISNANTLGIDEKQLLAKTGYVLSEVTRLERTCRKALYEKSALVLEDHYYRAYGLIKYARKLEIPEVIDMLSWMTMTLSSLKENMTELSFEKINKIAMGIFSEHERNVGIVNVSKRALNNSIRRAERIRSILEGDDKE